MKNPNLAQKVEFGLVCRKLKTVSMKVVIPFSISEVCPTKNHHVPLLATRLSQRLIHTNKQRLTDDRNIPLVSVPVRKVV